MNHIAFLALSQAHQHLHWLPVALRLARQPGVRVTVLSSSRAGLAFIQGYDPEGTLRLRWLPTPTVRRDGLFTPPPRRWALRLYRRYIGRFATVVTAETTSSLLKRFPSFKSRLVLIKHGAGDREGGYKSDYRFFDLTLVAGEKDRRRLIERGLATEENCVVAGYAKFELVKPSARLFPDDNPVALYNPHFDPAVSSWFSDGPALIAAMAAIPHWNFVVAPHVRLKTGPVVRSSAPNVRIDRGSVRSVDMSYTQAASLYIGDASSQVYEFIRTPRPCIFINAHGVDWRGDEAYDHWRLGQVIERAEELAPAIARAAALQPQYEALQRAALARSIDTSTIAASERQAQAILALARPSGG
ncbi:MAG: glycosyl transferase [Sphingomicrobium sp.]